jgi:GH15 family glucan-1,4-alpha-glucosidase
MRHDGFVPIGDYAALGDGRTVALVARDGRVDWLPVPAIDGGPIFGALLDPDRGGYFALAPLGEFRAERRYVPDTNILETTFHTRSGSVRVTDGLLLQDGGMLSWIELARRIECLEGSARLRYEVVPRHDFGAVETRIEPRRDALVATAGSIALAFRAWGAGEPEATRDTIAGEFELTAGEAALLACQTCSDEPIALPPRDEIELRFDRTIDAWRRWASFHSHEAPWRDEVTRSALTLKLLIAAHTGAIAAAPTTSLPERVGGDLNWDYRFSWVRDSGLTMDSLGGLGYREQVHASLSWLLRATQRTHPKLRPFYQLDGEDPGPVEELDIRGWRDSRPVRRGNRARDQRQLGSYGDLLETVHLYVAHGNTLNAATGARVAEVVDQVCDEWRKEDCGIWELTEERHWTHSKIACWTALDRGLRLAERGEIPRDRVPHWRAERDAIRAWVDDECWSDSLRTYVSYAGGEELDAAVLLAARTGYLDRGNPRLDWTIDAIARGLDAGRPLLYRYTGCQGREGAFLACSFWLVLALARAGRVDEARAMMEELLGLANDVGLYGEQLDPATHEQLGNFPQGLTHLSLLIAATAIADAEG